MCGAIRDQFEFKSTIFKLLKLKKEKKIHEIIVSTWTGELDNFEDLRSIIEQLDIHVIESPPYNSTQHLNEDMAYFRQAYQLNVALQHVPDTDYILKCRTDFSIPNIIEIMEGIEQCDMSISKRNIFNMDFNAKIYVGSLGLSAPFVCSDIAFFGIKEDVVKLISFDPCYQYINDKLWSDCLFFINPFIRRFQFIQEYLKIINYWEIKKIFEQSYPKCTYLPRCIIKFYGLYFKILDSCYIHFDKEYKNNIKVTARDLFLSDKNNDYVYTPWIKFIKDSRVIQDFFQSESDCEIDKNIKKICTLLDNSEEIFNLKITEDDLKELEEWASTFENCNKIIKKKNKILTHSNKEIGDNELIQTIFSSESLTLKQYSDLKQIIDKITNSKDYYYEIVRNISNISDISPSMREMCCVTASRRMECYLILELAYKLYTGDIKKENVPQAEFSFNKYGSKKTIFFMMPMSLERLGASYYYSKYKSITDHTFENNFVKEMSKFYNLENVKTAEDVVSYLANNIFKYREKPYYKELICFLILVSPPTTILKLVDREKQYAIEYIEKMFLKYEKYMDYNIVYSLFFKNPDTTLLKLILKHIEQDDTSPMPIYPSLKKIQWNNNKESNELLKDLFKKPTAELIKELELSNAIQFCPIACVNIGNNYMDGKIVEKNYTKALHYYKCAQNIDASNVIKVLDCLQVINTEDSLLEMWTIANNPLYIDNPNVIGRIGRYYKNGIYVEKNLKEAATWLKKARKSVMEKVYVYQFIHLYLVK